MFLTGSNRLPIITTFNPHPNPPTKLNLIQPFKILHNFRSKTLGKQNPYGQKTHCSVSDERELTLQLKRVISTIVSVEVNIFIYWYSANIRIYLLLDKELDRKIDVTPMQFLLAQNRQQTHDWTLIGSGANGLGILECVSTF